jgi:hypothetical protein
VVLAFYTMVDTVTPGGVLVGGLETNGQFVFTAIVIVVNVKVLVSSYEFSFWTIVSVFFGITAELSILFVFGIVPIYNMQGQFEHLFMAGPQPYLVLFFIMSGYLLIDIGDRWANDEFLRWSLKRQEKKAIKERRVVLRDNSIVRKKVTNFKSKFLASLTAL